MPARPTTVLVGHGTRDPEGVAEFEALLAGLRALDEEREVLPGFIEISRPLLPQALRAAAARGRPIVVLPATLFSASHVRRDIPEAVREASALPAAPPFRIARPIGVDARIAELLEVRARGALGNEDPAGAGLLLVGRGTSDPESNADFYRLGRLVWERLRVAFLEFAFVGVTRPAFPEALDRCLRLAPRPLVILPHLLFTGRVHKAIPEKVWAAAPGATEIRLAPHIGPDPVVARILHDREREAAGD